MTKWGLDIPKCFGSFSSASGMSDTKVSGCQPGDGEFSVAGKTSGFPMCIAPRAVNKKSPRKLNRPPVAGRRFFYFEVLVRQTRKELTHIMKSLSQKYRGKPSLRIQNTNPDHHLWNNNGTWWCHYTLHLPDYTKKRVRHGLGTSDLERARQLRDSLFAHLATQN